MFCVYFLLIDLSFYVRSGLDNGGLVIGRQKLVSIVLDILVFIERNLLYNYLWNKKRYQYLDLVVEIGWC